jgi:transcriptional regulator with XRE-family HTH domain
MAQKIPTPAQLRALRQKQGLNQHEFWPLFGVSQSGGSRYERGRRPPPALILLLYLRYSGKLTDKDLIRAGKTTRKTGENALRTQRLAQGLISQKDFWRRFGVLQSAGSRYETGRALPPAPVALLMALRQSGRLTDADLDEAGKTFVQRRRKAGSANK